MDYTFSWSWFMIGLLITGVSTALFVWYRPIADTMGSGVASYERFKLWGLIGVAVGFVVMLNLHSVLLNWVFSSIFAR